MPILRLRHFPIIIGLGLCLALVEPLGQALAQAVPEDDVDQETARKALENKEILPLSTVLTEVEGKITGDVVEIELERKNGLWVYEIEVIGEDGRVRDFDVDAKTGEVINVALDE
jgi:uncharacterized membrane protein YkoI